MFVVVKLTDQSPQSIVVYGGQFSQQLPVTLQLLILRLLLASVPSSVGHSEEIISQLLSQQRLIQLPDEPLEDIGHVMFTAAIRLEDPDSEGRSHTHL